MTDITLGKPLPNSAGLYSTDCRRSTYPPTGPEWHSGGGRAISGGKRLHTLGVAPHAAAVGDV